MVEMHNDKMLLLYNSKIWNATQTPSEEKTGNTQLSSHVPLWFQTVWLKRKQQETESMKQTSGSTRISLYVWDMGLVAKTLF